MLLIRSLWLKDSIDSLAHLECTSRIVSRSLFANAKSKLIEFPTDDCFWKLQSPEMDKLSVDGSDLLGRTSNVWCVTALLSLKTGISPGSYGWHDLRADRHHHADNWGYFSETPFHLIFMCWRTNLGNGPSGTWWMRESFVQSVGCLEWQPFLDRCLRQTCFPLTKGSKCRTGPSLGLAGTVAFGSALDFFFLRVGDSSSKFFFLFELLALSISSW